MKPLTSGASPSPWTTSTTSTRTRSSVRAREDFSWKGILDFSTCTECGRCQSQCPAWNTEKPLSPKLLITALRDHTYAKAAGDEAHTDRHAGRRRLQGRERRRRRRRPRLLLQPCGRRLRHRRRRALELHVVRRLRPAVPRRHRARRPHHGHATPPAAGRVELPAELNQLFKGLENKGNPWNMSPSARMDWSRVSSSTCRSSGRTWSPSSRWTGSSGSAARGRTRTARRRPRVRSPAGRDPRDLLRRARQRRDLHR